MYGTAERTNAADFQYHMSSLTGARGFEANQTSYRTLHSIFIFALTTDEKRQQIRRQKFEVISFQAATNSSRYYGIGSKEID